MKLAAAKKSSLTLPPPEFSLVGRLKKKLQLKSNTAVVRLALHELQTRVDRASLRAEFKKAVRLVKANKAEMAELDQMADEGLD